MREQPATRRSSGRTARTKALLALLCLLILPAVAYPQAASPPARQGDEYTIRIDVDSVVLHATVRNRKGTPVSGLGRSDFEVYEDGVLQRIQYFSHEDIPVTVGLVVDNSGSMRTKRQEVIAAAFAFARSSNPQDQMFAVGFNEHVSFGLPAGTPFTDQASQLRVALSRIRADGQTALYDAIAAAFEHLNKGTREKKVLIVISDGGDNASKRNLAQIVAMVKQSDVIMYTIGLFDENDGDQNPRVLRQLADATGGEVFLPQLFPEVVPICERIAQDIRNQYTIAYVPTNRRRDGNYRAIEVRAESDRGRLFVRTRAGYYGLKAQPAPAVRNPLP